MSTDTEHVEEESETSHSLLETWRNWYHVPLVGLVIAFMFWTRTQEFDRFVTDDGTPRLAGVDSWYHWRVIQWTSENYPHTMPYEVWTSFPTGRYVGQFGTLFDQLIVTVAMIVGLGNPSQETLYTVALLSIPAMAALTAIPVFYGGRRLAGTFGGIVSVVVLALAPGQFFSRSTVGQLDHHVGEVLFMAIAVVSMMVALRVAEREKPIYELVVSKDWDALKTPTLYAVLAGLALSLYVWVWPSAVALVGIFGIFFAVHLCLDYVRGVSPDHVAFVGAVSLGVTALVTAVLIEEPGFSVTSFGYLQPLLAILVSVGCVFMAWLARQWNARNIERAYYPIAIGGLITAAFLLMWLLLPDLYGTIVDNAVRRILPVGTNVTDSTIAEAQPPENFSQHVVEEFGMAFYTMLAGLAFLAIRPLRSLEFRAEHTLVIIWSLFLTSMAATQVRFSYYLVLAVAIVNAAFVAGVWDLVNLDVSLERGRESLKSLETYQVLTVVLVVLLLFAPMLPPIASATTWDSGESVGPHEEAMVWQDSNHWLADNTPEPGAYGGADNADELDYYGTYEYPEDGDYDYPEGGYGVMSWWDYGHLITTQGERIPHANPFQAGATSASAYFTADSEERSELILEALGTGESVSDESNEDLEEIVAESDESDEEMRYVMIDDAMAGSKFSAITQWSGPGYENYVEQGEFEAQGQPLPSASENYDDTTLASLYVDDAAEMEHYRLVHENDQYSVVGGMMLNQQQQGPIYSLPLRYALDDPSWNAQTAQMAASLEESNEAGEVNTDLGAQIWDAHITSSVKTFERVDGATLTGTAEDAPEGSTVYASVELETNTERPFTYVQEAEVGEDGTFEVTVPYATNDELGVDDGYTDSAVEATGDYDVTVASDDGENATAIAEGEQDVSETAVVDGEELEVTLEGAEDESFEPPEAGTNVDDVGDEENEANGDGSETEDGGETPIGDDSEGGAEE
ncbi:oligosaccharyl transferase, archaeosortase A system-associated [Natrialbaceae archaeon GCM10025810]|uniref:oligosaccharyl transferase, archaeosortase A system-associated n=1 Tax=Halovalidus salilacus TaxID=3075124 RepID=UPI00360B9FC3